MQLRVSALPERGPVEIVERKGLGHPDTLCDALAEELSRAYSRWTLERFGVIPHHNVDKALLVGGRSAPRWGGGEVLEPITLILAGRVTTEVGGVQVPVEELARERCEGWLRARMPHLDLARHLRLEFRFQPGSTDLRALYGRGRAANDTSVGVGFAPLSALERAVLQVERALVDPGREGRHPAWGQDLKVMGVELDGERALTVACAMVDRPLGGLEDYREAVEAARALAERVAEGARVVVNAADDLARGAVYLTVTGTSAEAGDDGEVGRGNRANGLITPMRPMTMEAAAGKNPVTHTGKLYSALARRIAEALVRDRPEVGGAECLLLSRIGQPLSDPWLVHVRLARPAPSAWVEELARAELSGLDDLTRALVAGEIAVC